jgi:hypothetical protein
VRRQALAVRAIAIAVAVLVAACDTPAPSTAPTATAAPEPTPLQVTYDLATDVWYEGLRLHVGQATSILDGRGGTVEIIITIENPEDDASSLDAAFSLAVGGERLEPTRDSQVPTPPGGESRLALLSFELQAIASADDAVLEIGAAPEHVAKVPFTPAAGRAVRFEPLQLELKGSASAGELRLSLKSGILRWDLPDWSQELPANLLALTVTYDATFRGSFSGGFPFTGDNVALRLPNGDVVEARRDGHSQSIELIGAGKTKKNLSSRFEIPADATGEFQLLVRNGSTRKGIKFVIDPVRG